MRAAFSKEHTSASAGSTCKTRSPRTKKGSDQPWRAIVRAGRDGSKTIAEYRVATVAAVLHADSGSAFGSTVNEYAAEDDIVDAVRCGAHRSHPVQERHARSHGRRVIGNCG